MVSRSNTWDASTFGGTRDFLRITQGAIRGLFARSGIKIQYLDNIPHLFVRLGKEAGIREKIKIQYAALTYEQHDPISNVFCAPGSPFLTDLDAMPDDFTMPARLEKQVKNYGDASMMDHINEGPHALFKKEVVHAPSSTFPWQSATVRINQNLIDIKNITDVLNVDLQREWDRLKSVVRSDLRKHPRSLRTSRQDFEERFYFCKEAFELSEVQATEAIKQLNNKTIK
jgi:hypothetical protein